MNNNWLFKALEALLKSAWITSIMIERVVDDIVCKVRLLEWQATSAGERGVRKALQRPFFKYKLHSDIDLFETRCLFV